MSMPCPQGAGGLARHSPALPRREMSILCLLKFWKAVDMTFTPSYVRAPVYCRQRADNLDLPVLKTEDNSGKNEEIYLYRISIYPHIFQL